MIRTKFADPQLFFRLIQKGDHRALGLAGVQPAADCCYLWQWSRHHYFCQREDLCKTLSSLAISNFIPCFVPFLRMPFPAGHHCRGEASEEGGGARRREPQVQGGRTENAFIVWDAWRRKTSELLLLQLLERSRSSPGLALSVGQPPVLLLPPAGQRGYEQTVNLQVLFC